MPCGFARETAVLAEAAGCPQHPGIQPWREDPTEARWSLPAAPPRDGLFAGTLGLKETSCPFGGVVIASISA